MVEQCLSMVLLLVALSGTTANFLTGKGCGGFKEIKKITTKMQLDNIDEPDCVLITDELKGTVYHRIYK